MSDSIQILFPKKKERKKYLGRYVDIEYWNSKKSHKN